MPENPILFEERQLNSAALMQIANGVPWQITDPDQIYQFLDQGREVSSWTNTVTTDPNRIDNGRVATMIPRSCLYPIPKGRRIDRNVPYDTYQLRNIIFALKKSVAEQLAQAGVPAYVEEGVIVPDDVDMATARLKTSSKWARIHGTNLAGKMEEFGQDVTILSGERPKHKYLQDERLLAEYISGEASALNQRFYAMAPFAGGKKNLLEKMTEASSHEDLEKVLIDMTRVMSAVAHLHSLRMVHRDLKPSNAREGGILTDNTLVARYEELINDSSLVGTEAYIPDRYRINFRTPFSFIYRDIFALAMSLASILNGASQQAQGSDPFNDFIEEYDSEKVGDYLSLADFVAKMKSCTYLNVQNEKFDKVWTVIENLIVRKGAYKVTDALRDMEAIFGTKIE